MEPDDFIPEEAGWGHASMRPLIAEARSGSLRIWKRPVSGRQYVLGADVAEGKARDLGSGKARAGIDMFRGRPDYSAAEVIDFETAENVAEWHGYLEPNEYAQVLVALGLHYNRATIICEVNGPGSTVNDTMVRVFRYPRLYRRKIWGREITHDWSTGEWGWSTQTNTRPFLITRIHEWLKGPPLTKNADLVRELRTMEIDVRTGQARAMGRNKDDRVLALGMALQARYERLYSRLAEEEDPPQNRLPPEDQDIWFRMKKRKELNERARRNTDGRSSLPRLPALPRGSLGSR